MLSSLRVATDDSAPDAGLPSLAVLPLANYSGDPEQDHVAVGITEELIGELGRIRGLRVISRTSVTQFKDTELSIPAIADSLAVGHVIEGSVARDGERIRLRLQLIRARPETHVWTEAYERDVREVLSLQREVAQTVAHALGVGDGTFPGASPSPAPPRTADVFDVYLKGLYRTSRLEFDQASRQFEQAIRLDPTFAPAYAALAGVYLGEHAFGSLPGLEAYSRGKSAAERALVLDPSSVEAHIALGRVYALNWQWPEAERRLRRAVEINPSHIQARDQYAGYLCAMGRYDEAIMHAKEARRMDPLSQEANRHLGETLLCAGRFEEAVEHLELMVELGMPSYEDLAYAYLAVGRTEEGLAAMRAAEEQSFPDPERSERLAIAFAMAGHDAEARRTLGNIAQDSARVNPVAFAVVWAHLGDLDRAVEYLEHAYRVRDPWLWQIGHPLFAPLRGHPRYETLIDRMGLPKPAT